MGLRTFFPLVIVILGARETTPLLYALADPFDAHGRPSKALPPRTQNASAAEANANNANAFLEVDDKIMRHAALSLANEVLPPVHSNSSLRYRCAATAFFFMSDHIYANPVMCIMILILVAASRN